MKSALNSLTKWWKSSRLKIKATQICTMPTLVKESRPRSSLPPLSITDCRNSPRLQSTASTTALWTCLRDNRWRVVSRPVGWDKERWKLRHSIHQDFHPYSTKSSIHTQIITKSSYVQIAEQGAISTQVSNIKRIRALFVKIRRISRTSMALGHPLYSFQHSKQWVLTHNWYQKSL